jgi:cytidine deaminase
VFGASQEATPPKPFHQARVVGTFRTQNTQLSPQQIRRFANLAYAEAYGYSLQPSSFERNPFGAAVLLSDGTTRCASNWQFAPSDAICAERAAMHQALRGEPTAPMAQLPTKPWVSKWQLLSGKLTDWLKSSDPPAPVAKTPAKSALPRQIEALATTPLKPNDPELIQFSPCGACLESMMHEPAMRADTLIITPKASPGGPITLEARPLSDYLPAMGHTMPSWPQTKARVYTLPVHFSPEALLTLRSAKLAPEEAIRHAQTVMGEALQACQAGQDLGRNQRNGQDAGAAVAFFSQDGRPLGMSRGSNAHATDRYRVSALADALSNAAHQPNVQTLKAAPIQLIGYASPVDSLLDHPQDLEMWFKWSVRRQTLIAVTEHDIIQVRTLGECLPRLYTKRKDLRALPEPKIPVRSNGRL